VQCGPGGWFAPPPTEDDGDGDGDGNGDGDGDGDGDGEIGVGGVGEGGGGGRGGEGGGRGSEGGGGGSKHSLSNKQNEPLLTGVLMQQQYSAPGEPGVLITDLIWVPDPSRLQPNRLVTPDPTLQDTELGPYCG